jgi:hypothetical protein
VALLVTAVGIAPAFAKPDHPQDAGGTGARAFSNPVLVDGSDPSWAAEPSIRAAQDGALYITAPVGLGSGGIPRVVDSDETQAVRGGDMLWRSTDGGATWTELGSYDGAAGGGDSDITSTPGGTLFASGLTLACVTLSRSGDQGQSWVTNPIGGCGGTVADDRQWNDTYGEDVVYTAFGNIALGTIEVSRSDVLSPLAQGGPSVPVSGDTEYQWPGVLDVDQRTGSVAVGWNTVGAPNDCDEGCSAPASSAEPDEVRVAVLDDTGTPVAGSPFLVASRPFDTFDSFVSVDTGRDGTVYAAWSERHPEASETWTMLASSADGGRTWSAPVKVNASPATTTFPWVSAGDAGRVAVSYYGTSAGGASPEVVNGDWSVYSAFSDDGGQSFDESQVTGTMHQGSICTSGTGCASGTRDLADFFETDYDARGCLVTTYTDNSRDVVAPDGERTTDEPTHIAFVRQTSGPGLLADTDCGASAPGKGKGHKPK